MTDDELVQALRHEAIVPPWAGRPWCTCGYIGGNGIDRPLLADHMREVDPDFQVSSREATATCTRCGETSASFCEDWDCHKGWSNP